jgi:ParB family transcriptional regulator, chromosome partitioning protein
MARPSMAGESLFGKSSSVLSAFGVRPTTADEPIEETLSKAEVATESIAIVIVHPRPRNRIPQRLEGLVQSIQSIGITDPLLVRPHPGKSGEYEILSGHRRRAAAEQAGLTEVPAKIFEVDDEVAAEIAAASNFQREDPNPLEETDAMLELLSIKLRKTETQVISLFHLYGNDKSNVALTQDWQSLEAVFAASTCKISPETFRTKRLPLLNMPEEIQAAIREGKLEYTKAIALNRLKDEQKRQELLQEVLVQNLSVREISDRVKAAKPKKAVDDNPVNQMKQTYQKVKASKTVWEDAKKRQKLEKLLKQIEELIGADVAE